MKLTVVLVILGLVLAGCASVPVKPKESNAVVFKGGLGEVKEVAKDAIIMCGFDVKKEEDGYLEGFRPRKIGLFIGSGGETIGIWLEPVDTGKVKVFVQTVKSMVGMAGQKRWEQPVIDEMKKKLKSL